jgi:hypothetical protein
LTLSLAANDQWQLSPADPAIATGALQSLVANWEQATAYYVRRFQDNATGETITLELADDAAPVILHIVARAPELILARPDQGIQYHLHGETGTSLLTLPVDVQETGTDTTD